MDEHLRFYQNFLAATNPRRSTGLVPTFIFSVPTGVIYDHETYRMEPEFTELQWKNGNMLLQSSPLKKHQGFINEVKEDQKTVLNSDTPAVEDEIASFFPYEYLEKEFGCDFLCEPNPHAFTIDKTNKSLNLPHYQSRLSPPKTYVHDSPQHYVRPENSSNVNFCSFSRPQKIDMSNGFHKKINSELGGESLSMMTAGSSICGSNQVQNQAAGLSNTTTIVQQRNFKEDFETSMLSERLYTDTYEITGTSSSGRSGVSIRSVGPQEINNQSYKRKEREIEDFCSPSEETNYESADEKKAAQRSRRSRAAEVHNFSERKRRDRINEKMKALQDLIPHCTKSDKASMLDETIEYLKSLQQQVQIMWMGSGMATMMFPNIQNYMAQVGLGIGRSPMLQLPSSSSTNQMQMCPQSINHMRFSNQMHNSQTPESFAPLLGFHHMQPSPQGMSLYAYGAQVAQQNQMAALLKNSGMQSDGFAHDNQNGK